MTEVAAAAYRPPPRANAGPDRRVRRGTVRGPEVRNRDPGETGPELVRCLQVEPLVEARRLPL